MKRSPFHPISFVIVVAALLLSLAPAGQPSWAARPADAVQPPEPTGALDLSLSEYLLRPAPGKTERAISDRAGHGQRPARAGYSDMYPSQPPAPPPAAAAVAAGAAHNSAAPQGEPADWATDPSENPSTNLPIYQLPIYQSTNSQSTNLQSPNATFVVNNTNDSGAGSLRQAILDANANPGADDITFDIAGTAPFTISLTTPLPVLTDTVRIDATTQPGYAGAPLIVLDGGAAGAGALGLDINAASCTVKGLVIQRFNGWGIQVRGPGGATIAGNYIGMAADGVTARGNGQYGIALSAPDNVIGGTTAAERNVISGNGNHGINIASGANGNVVRGNIIGADATGALDRGNIQNGVWIGSANNTIGGTAAGAGNLISGNDNRGITFSGASATGNSVLGNIIGLNATGAAALGNTGNGVYLESGAASNTIGGASAAERNVISGNVRNGVSINTGAGGANQVLGNYIGVDATGTLDRGNNLQGVWIGTANNTIRGNVISGNNDHGIYVSGAGATGNSIQGNIIGLDAAGATAVGNTNNGVYILSNAANTTIGGATAAERNVISGNTYHGVSIASGSNGNVVRGNIIGADVTGALDRGNTYQGLWVGSANNTIGGNVISGNNDNGICVTGANATGNVIQGNIIGLDAAGATALGNTNNGVYILSNAANTTIGGATAAERNVISGNTYHGVSIASGANSNVVRGNYIGTDATGALDRGNARAGVWVGTANNSIGGTAIGAGNLIAGNNSYGLLFSGSTATGNTVQGNLIGLNAAGTTALGNVDYGIRIYGGANNTIGGSAAGAGNVVSGNSGYGIGIDYTGATGNTVQGNIVGLDATGAADLGNTKYGVWIYGVPNNTIGGTTATGRNVIAGNDQYGVVISGAGASNNVVQGNYIGADATGALARSNSWGGVYLLAANNTIGGTAAGARNLISGQTGMGVILSGAGATGNLVQGNYIGTDASGTAALGNDGGVMVTGGATGNTLGGTAAGAGNLISGNRSFGVYVGGSSTRGTAIQGNVIGADASGTLPLGNGGEGIVLEASNTTVGGAGNLIAFNGADGVAVYGDLSTGNAILGNSIFANTGLGINLNYAATPPVDPNDYQDPDAGANRTQNYPVLKAVAQGSTIITGTLNSTPNTAFRLEFFANSAGDPSDYGEGQTYLGAITVTTDSAGDAAFVATLTATTPITHCLSATATDPANNTSEFSRCIRANVWTGAVSRDWHTAGNWTNGVPDASSAAIIPPTANDPIIAAAGGVCANLDLRGGATLTLAGGGLESADDVSIAGVLVVSGSETIRVGGHWRNSGTFQAGAGAVIFAGSSLQMIAGVNAFHDLTIANASGVSAAGSALAVTGLLSVEHGAFTTASDLHDVAIGWGATLIAGGDMSVSGEWTNLGAFTPGAHTVALTAAASR